MTAPPSKEPTAATGPAPVLVPPALQPAKAAIDRGDFRQGRRLIIDVLAGNPSAELAAAARDLQSATENDPWAVRLGLAAVTVLALVVGAYIL